MSFGPEPLKKAQQAVLEQRANAARDILIYIEKRNPHDLARMLADDPATLFKRQVERPSAQALTAVRLASGLLPVLRLHVAAAGWSDRERAVSESSEFGKAETLPERLSAVLLRHSIPPAVLLPHLQMACGPGVQYLRGSATNIHARPAVRGWSRVGTFAGRMVRHLAKPPRVPENLLQVPMPLLPDGSIEGAETRPLVDVLQRLQRNAAWLSANSALPEGHPTNTDAIIFLAECMFVAWQAATERKPNLSSKNGGFLAVTADLIGVLADEAGQPRTPLMAAARTELRRQVEASR